MKFPLVSETIKEQQPSRNNLSFHKNIILNRWNIYSAVVECFVICSNYFNSKIIFNCTVYSGNQNLPLSDLCPTQPNEISVPWLSSCLFQGYTYLIPLSGPQKTQIQLLNLSISFLSIDTCFCQCLEFTCTQDPTQYPSVVEVVQRAVVFPTLAWALYSELSLRLHCSFPVSSITGSCWFCIFTYVHPTFGADLILNRFSQFRDMGLTTPQDIRF